MKSLEKIVSSTKRIFGTSLLVGAIAVSSFLGGCGKSSDNQPLRAIQDESYPISDNQQLRAIQDASYPIWSNTDLELNKHEGMAIVYNHEFNVKLSFYNGSMPLKFSGTETPGRGYAYSSPRMMKYEFEDFSNYFIYDGLTLTGVVAVDKSNSLAAEAKIIYFIDEGRQGIKMEEFHYDSKGKLIFNCKSLIDPSMGFKKSEAEKIGRKQRDYFFIMPFGLNN